MTSIERELILLRTLESATPFLDFFLLPMPNFSSGLEVEARPTYPR